MGMSETNVDGRRKYLSVPEVCEILNVGKTTVYKLISDKKLPAKKFGGCTRVHVDALAEFEQESEWR